MARIVFNGQNPTTKGFALTAYNRNTTRDAVSGEIHCLAYAQIDAAANSITQLTTLLGSTISRIQIYNDEGAVAYDLNDITAFISSISETWNGTKVDIYLNVDTIITPAAGN